METEAGFILRGRDMEMFQFRISILDDDELEEIETLFAIVGLDPDEDLPVNLEARPSEATITIVDSKCLVLVIMLVLITRTISGSSGQLLHQCMKHTRVMAVLEPDILMFPLKPALLLRLKIHLL